ncbi:MAG: hypothetical protein J6J37_00935 [Bacteroidaceae bacterium]|nr:hypothetical protein [Bacteroidaceae bacterium]
MKKTSIQELKDRLGWNAPINAMPIDINDRDYYRSSIDPCNLYTKKQLIEKGIPFNTIVKRYDRRDVR